MPKTSKPPAPNPAVLRFKGRHSAAAVAIQMRNIDVFRRLANQICNDVKAMITQQAVSLAVNANRTVSTRNINPDRIELEIERERQNSRCNEYVEAPVERMDVYGHEKRIQMGFDGKSHLIVKRNRDLDEAHHRVVSRVVSNVSAGIRSSRDQSWRRQILGS